MKRFLHLSFFIFNFLSLILYPFPVFADGPTPTPVCRTQNAGAGNGQYNIVCSTAFGNISTRPADLIGTIFGLILGVSGSIAILLIIFGGYRLMMAQGNSEKTQEAKETITSAILGLLFILFSTTILQIIGIDVLGLKGIFK